MKLLISEKCSEKPIGAFRSKQSPLSEFMRMDREAYGYNEPTKIESIQLENPPSWGLQHGMPLNLQTLPDSITSQPRFARIAAVGRPI